MGSYNTQTEEFALWQLEDCEAHPHDGLAIDAEGHLWWDEEFVNALGELVLDAPE